VAVSVRASLLTCQQGRESTGEGREEYFFLANSRSDIYKYSNRSRSLARSLTRPWFIQIPLPSLGGNHTLFMIQGYKKCVCVCANTSSRGERAAWGRSCGRRYERVLKVCLCVCVCMALAHVFGVLRMIARSHYRHHHHCRFADIRTLAGHRSSIICSTRGGRKLEEGKGEVTF